jgi:catechol 2,3-dioxygenase
MEKTRSSSPLVATTTTSVSIPGRGATSRPPLYPERRELAKALRSLIDAGYPLDGASDHGVSEALYLSDPDDNGVELYCDRPHEEWPRDRDGGLAMVTRPLDLGGLLAELEEVSG